jgi:hypothetical protein
LLRRSSYRRWRRSKVALGTCRLLRWPPRHGGGCRRSPQPIGGAATLYGRRIGL